MLNEKIVLSRSTRALLTMTLSVVLFLLSACESRLLKESAQELTGGGGAGLSEYQE
jgi:hypothetical protein